MHADRSLSASAFLVKDRDDFSWHYDLSFSAESAIISSRNFSQSDVLAQLFFEFIFQI